MPHPIRLAGGTSGLAVEPPPENHEDEISGLSPEVVLLRKFFSAYGGGLFSLSGISSFVDMHPVYANLWFPNKHRCLLPKESSH